MIIVSYGVLTLLMAAPHPREAFNLLRRCKRNGFCFVGVIICILWAQTGVTVHGGQLGTRSG